MASRKPAVVRGVFFALSPGARPLCPEPFDASVYPAPRGTRDIFVTTIELTTRGEDQ